MQLIPITINGHKKLKLELDDLKNVKRPEIIKEIQTARAHGDLSENAEYKFSKEKQSFIEGRIAQLEDIISRSQVIDPKSLSGDVVKFGATVTLKQIDNDEVKVYQIVGEEEADLSNGLISCKTPIANSIMNKSSGDLIIVTTPRGTKEYTIIKVEYI